MSKTSKLYRKIAGLLIMKIFFIIPLISCFATSCKKDYSAPVPDYNNWNEFTAANPLHLSNQSRKIMEGMYDLKTGNDVFGESVAVKWSYVINANDTTYHISFFFGKDIAYFICQGKMSNGDILLNGYWRKMVSVETGIVRLTIKAQEGALLISGNSLTVAPGSITISGFFGNGQDTPAIPFSCIYARPLYNKTPFKILGDRCGARNSDFLPVSENSIGLILKTADWAVQA